jgi:hydroxymethylglutaryl-CoA lyase
MTSVDVVVRDVGPRDGLQSEAPVPVADRVRLIEALVAAGVRRIEACSFVSPKAVPSMAGAAEVMASVPRAPGVVTYTALVPNVRGAEMALASSVDELTVTISASEAYNQKNVRMSVDESVDVVASICALSTPSVPVDAVVSCAFGSPYEGDLAVEDVASLCGRLRDVGVSALTLADTTGMATPVRLASVVDAVGSAESLGLHLHETRGTGLVNAYAALSMGVRRFDTSVGGLGGSPFADGAAGNLATEALVYLLDDMGLSTGISLPALLEAATLVESLIGHPLPSAVAKAGPRLPAA